MERCRGTYGPLCRHLLTVQEKRWAVTFKEIEEILAFPLPTSAREHRAWWGNDGTHVQARAWRAAGWRTQDVDLGAETLVFERSAPRA